MINRLISIVLYLLMAASPAAAQAPATVLDQVNVYLKTNQVRIRALNDVRVQVRLTDASGKLRAYTEQRVPAAGFQTLHLRTASGHPAVIQPNDSVVVTPEDGEPVVVTAVHLDARPVTESDTILLEGPASERLQVQVWRGSEVPRTYATTTDVEGSAALELAGVEDLSPGLGGLVGYEPADGRAVVLPFQVPTVVAVVGSDLIEGIAWPGREVSLTLEDGAGPVEYSTGRSRSENNPFHGAGQPLATTRLQAGGEQCFSPPFAVPPFAVPPQAGQFPQTGCFSVRLAEQFAGLRITPGQTLRVTWEDQAITLTVPELSIHADPASDQITGRAPAGAELSIALYDQATGRQVPLPDRTADPTGQFQIDLTGYVDINPNDHTSVTYKTPDGHKLVAEFRVPFVELELGSHRISGRGVERAGVVAELQAMDGTPKATAQTTVDTRGNFILELEAGRQPMPVTAGDTLRITVGEEPITLDVPTLTVHPDPDQERVTGQGPPGEPLEISLEAGGGPRKGDRLTRQVTPDASGTYSLDVRDQADIRAGARAMVTYTTPGEHRISAQDRLTQVTVQAGADHIVGVTDPDTAVDITVRDPLSRSPAGQLKDWAHTTADRRGRFAADIAADCRTPAIIEPGDEITVTTGEEDISLTIPNLTVALDPESDAASGTGPAGTTVEIRLSAANGSRQDEITIGDDGRYTISYAPDIDIQAGDQATALLVNPAGHRIFVLANVPAASARLGESVLRGTVAPLESVHVTLRDGSEAPKAEATATSSRDGSFAVAFRDDAGRRVPIEAGDFVDIETASTTQRVEVPPLSLTLDPAGPTVAGTSLPDTTVELTFVTQSRFYVGYTVEADAEGHYQASFDPHIAVRAGDWASAQITTREGFKATRLWSAPHLTAYAGINYVKVGVRPPVPMTVTLRSKAGALRARSTVDPTGEEALLFTPAGEPAIIQAGDRISLERGSSVHQRASAASPGIYPPLAMTVPTLTVKLDPESSAVYGAGPAGGEVSIGAAGTGGEDSHSTSVPVWADGTYTARLAGLDLGAGASASVSYTDPTTQHRTVRETYRGWFRAHVGGSTLEVRADPLSEVTVQLRGAEGEVKGEAGPIRVDHRGRATIDLQGASTLQRASAPSPRIYSPAPVIQTGDHLELTTSKGVAGLTVPQVAFGINVAANEVFGAVPEPGVTSVTLTTSDGCTYTRQPAVASDGRFQADFASAADIGPGDRVTLHYTTGAGHELEIQRAVHAAYLPLIATNH